MRKQRQTPCQTAHEGVRTLTGSWGAFSRPDSQPTLISSS
ncbi:hypothetical protein J2Z31_002939 [Sinorhizobium kostiense]|uniref:Uncharacterized protein n=1 Tax=Sinorhizobium kostiense TaxID=76747 RepID=A0ABS4R0K7_9HYPH|nr:hypothetical protein [Sinorhizobium kostiense]